MHDSSNKLRALPVHDGAALGYGTVHGRDEDNYLVQSSVGMFTATRAFSCVVEPQTGDRVLYSTGDARHTHILAIVERPTGAAAHLSFPGDVELESRSGQVSVRAAQTVQLTAGQEVNLCSREFSLVASKGVIGVEDTTLVGERLNATVKHAGLYAHTIETVAERLSQYLTNSFRFIQGLDQSKAGNVLTTVRNLFSVRSRQAAMLAKGDIKIDAERIHMG